MRLAVTSAAVVLLAVLGAPLHAQCPALGAAAPAAGVDCRYDATLTREFTPRAAPAGTYRVFVTTTELETIAGRLRSAFPTGNNRPAWAVQALDPLDAFGDGGLYDRSRVARLYVGRRARVARGAIVRDGGVAASIWLVSPYPDPSLARLEPGTMIIEFRIPGKSPRTQPGIGSR